jgi:hypothetical protein
VPAAVKVQIEEWIVAADIYEGRISPDAEPLTYSEERQFLSNTGRSQSAEEARKLPPMGRRYLAQF